MFVEHSGGTAEDEEMRCTTSVIRCLGFFFLCLWIISAVHFSSTLAIHLDNAEHWKWILKQTLKMHFWTDSFSQHKYDGALNKETVTQANKMCYVVNVENNVSHFLYPIDVAVSSAFLLRIPARHVNTILSGSWGISPPYFSLKSSGPSWRAVFTCPTVESRNAKDEN